MDDGGPAPAKRPKMAAVGATQWKFLSAWFCPYAQRAWIALNHHRVPYEKIEALTLKIPPGQTLADAAGYEKHPLVLRHHPSGLVPTIVDAGESRPAVYDSLVCVQFVDDLAAAGGAPGGEALLPADPVQRAHARIWSEWADKTIPGAFYNILVPREAERRAEGFAKLRQGLRKFQESLKGPFFYGDSLSIVDIAVFPWCFRTFTCGIVELYRGPEFALSRDEFAPLLGWLDRCLALDSVKATLPEKQALIDTYKRYADGTAKSKVADAVRAGKNAHEHE